MVNRRRPRDERHRNRANSGSRFVALLSGRARHPLGWHPLPARYRSNARTPNIGDQLALGGFRDGFGRRPPAYCHLISAILTPKSAVTCNCGPFCFVQTRARSRKITAAVLTRDLRILILWRSRQKSDYGREGIAPCTTLLAHSSTI